MTRAVTLWHPIQTKHSDQDLCTPTASARNRCPKLAQRAREGLRKVALGEAQTITGWLEYGGALNEGAAQFTTPEGEQDDRRFGEWVSLSQLDTVDRMDRAAAMWAAANPAEFATIRVLNPKVRTVRE